MADQDYSSLKKGDVVRAIVRRPEVFGLFCEFRSQEILVLIAEISWIPSFNSCQQVASAGDELEVKIIAIDKERKKSAGSLRAIHPENNPWNGSWHLEVGEVIDATVFRWVERADRCGNAGGYLLELRPGALVMLCGVESGQFERGENLLVKVSSIDLKTRMVVVELAR